MNDTTPAIGSSFSPVPVMASEYALRMVKQPAPGAVWISFFLYLLTAIWPLVVAPAVWFFALEPTVGGDRQAGLAHATAATINAAIALVQIVVVFLMRAGRRWVRTILVALTVISVVGLSVAGIFVGFTGPVGIGVIFATVLAATLMFTPAANRYFRCPTTRTSDAAAGTHRTGLDKTHD